MYSQYHTYRRAIFSELHLSNNSLLREKYSENNLLLHHNQGSLILNGKTAVLMIFRVHTQEIKPHSIFTSIFSSVRVSYKNNSDIPTIKQCLGLVPFMDDEPVSCC